MKKRIVVVGSSNTDMIIKTDRIPRPGETVIGGRFSTAPGGKGANQAVAAARAGGQVTFIGRVGNDIFGNEAIKGFVADNINIEHIIRDTTAPSGVASIIVDRNGRNCIAVAGGANMNLSPADIEAAGRTIATADILVMQLETPMETITAAATIARADNVKVILDPAPAQPLGDELLKTVSILTPNEIEAGVLADIPVKTEDDARKAAQTLLGRGVGAVMVTLGENGVIIATADGIVKVDAFAVDAVDTTAAGDVFNGALAVAIAEGKSLVEAAVFANAAAALSVTQLGAQPSAPMRSGVDEFMRLHRRSMP